MTKTIKKCIVCGSLNGYHKMSCYEHNRKDAMKFRNGFVSNSSSSSYVVIVNNLDTLTEVNIPENLIAHNTVLELGNIGETEFGWTPADYSDIESKLNLAWLLANDTPKFIDMLINVIKKKNNSIDFILFNENELAYIDHQSVDDLMEIYSTEETLYNFLFNRSSYIHTDNDNH